MFSCHPRRLLIMWSVFWDLLSCAIKVFNKHRPGNSRDEMLIGMLPSVFYFLFYFACFKLYFKENYLYNNSQWLKARRWLFMALNYGIFTFEIMHNPILKCWWKKSRRVAIFIIIICLPHGLGSQGSPQMLVSVFSEEGKKTSDLTMTCRISQSSSPTSGAHW